MLRPYNLCEYRKHAIKVSKSSDLVYTDYSDRSINIITNTLVQPLTRLQGWRPLSLCGTSSGDVLVTMITDDQKQSEVVRHSGSTEKKTRVHWGDSVRPLYSINVNA